MEVKSKVGWVVCEATKKKDKGKIICPYTRNKPYGISGYVYLYSTRGQAKHDAELLNEAWEKDIFVAKKARVQVIE